MRTDALIHQLIAEAGPVKRLSRPSVRFFRWLAVAASVSMVGVLYTGLRADLGTMLHEPFFVFRLAILIALVGLSGWRTFQLSIPGWNLRPAARMAPFGLLLVWLGIVAWELVGLYQKYGIHGFIPDGPGPCTKRLCALTIVPGLLLFVMVKRAWPLQARWSSAYVFLTAAGMGALASDLTCFSDCPFHLIVWHILPVILITAFGWLLGEKWLSNA